MSVGLSRPSEQYALDTLCPWMDGISVRQEAAYRLYKGESITHPVGACRHTSVGFAHSFGAARPGSFILMHRYGLNTAPVSP